MTICKGQGFKSSTPATRNTCASAQATRQRCAFRYGRSLAIIAPPVPPWIAEPSSVRRDAPLRGAPQDDGNLYVALNTYVILRRTPPGPPCGRPEDRLRG